MTTATLRKIERQDEAKFHQAWEDRRLGHDRRPPVWACDHLIRVGAITPAQHDAAQRYADAIARSQEGGGGHLERVDGGGSDPHARLWDRAVSAQVARQVRSFVLTAGRRRPTTKAVHDALFAFPQPSIRQMRGDKGGSETERKIRNVLELVEAAFKTLDAGYGR